MKWIICLIFIFNMSCGKEETKYYSSNYQEIIYRENSILINELLQAPSNDAPLDFKWWRLDIYDWGYGPVIKIKYFQKWFVITKEGKLCYKNLCYIVNQNDTNKLKNFYKKNVQEPWFSQMPRVKR
jgi:hypothetical protein